VVTRKREFTNHDDIIKYIENYRKNMIERKEAAEKKSWIGGDLLLPMIVLFQKN
jgi:hypothetical protein